MYSLANHKSKNLLDVQPFAKRFIAFQWHAAKEFWGWKWSNLIWPNVATRLLHYINNEHLLHVSSCSLSLQRLGNKHEAFLSHSCRIANNDKESLSSNFKIPLNKISNRLARIKVMLHHRTASHTLDRCFAIIFLKSIRILLLSFSHISAGCSHACCELFLNITNDFYVTCSNESTGCFRCRRYVKISIP